MWIVPAETKNQHPQFGQAWEAHTTTQIQEQPGQDAFSHNYPLLKCSSLDYQ
jgi:hypothetical protein